MTRTRPALATLLGLLVACTRPHGATNDEGSASASVALPTPSASDGVGAPSPRDTASPFEGIVRIEEDVGGMLRRSELAIAGKKMRLDIVGTPQFQIFDLARWEGLYADRDKREAARAKLDMPVGEELAGGSEATGRSRTILGRACDVWRLRLHSGPVEACLDREIPGYPIFARYVGNPAAIRQGGGPLPLVAEALSDKDPVPSLRVTSIERKRVVPSLFELPGDYKVGAASGFRADRR